MSLFANRDCSADMRSLGITAVAALLGLLSTRAAYVLFGPHPLVHQSFLFSALVCLDDRTDSSVRIGKDSRPWNTGERRSHIALQESRVPSRPLSLKPVSSRLGVWQSLPELTIGEASAIGVLWAID